MTGEIALSNVLLQILSRLAFYYQKKPKDVCYSSVGKSSTCQSCANIETGQAGRMASILPSYDTPSYSVIIPEIIHV